MKESLVATGVGAARVAGMTPAPGLRSQPWPSEPEHWTPASNVVITLALFLVPITVLVFGLRSALIDDAFIQFQYARNLAGSGTWGMLPGRVANTSTSALNVMLLAATASMTRGSLITAALLLTVAELIALLAILTLISGKLVSTHAAGLIAFAALALNPLLLSSVGLETILYFTLFFASILLFYAQRRYGLGFALGLLILARPDGVLLAAILFISSRSRGWARSAMACGATLIPWLAYSAWQFGTVVPDTLIIKMSQRWGGATFVSGVDIYIRAYPLPMIASFVLAPFALYACAARSESRSFARLLLGYATIHFVAYSALRVAPYHWYYSQQAVPLAVAGAFGVHALLRSPRRAARVVGLVGATSPVILFVVLIASSGWPLTRAPVHTNWASAGEYRSIATWLDANVPSDATVLVSGEIGALSFYSSRLFLNEFSDMNEATRQMDMLAPGTLGRLVASAEQPTRRSLPPVACPTFLVEQTNASIEDTVGKIRGGEMITAWTTSTSWKNHTDIIVWRVAGDSFSRYYAPCRVPTDQSRRTAN